MKHKFVERPAPKLQVERRRSSMIHSAMAILITAIFAMLCFAVFSIVVTSTNMESWAAGMVGAVVGYWANNLTQVVSYYFGGSSGPIGAMPGHSSQSVPGRLIRGKGKPPNSIGADGDYFYDETNKDTYGPKDSGSWGPPRDAVV